MLVAMRIPEFALSLCLAFCFAALGDLILRRCAHGLWEWNTSFLTGLAASAAILFPLSLLLPGHALLAVLILLLASGCWRLTKFGRPAWPPRLSVPLLKEIKRDPLALALLLLIVFQAGQFCVHNLRLSYLWDGYQIWATKALVLYHRGALTTDFLVPGQPDRLTGYPPLVPMFEALLALARGQFEWNSLKPVFPFFYVSMLVSTFLAARSLMSRRWALGATAILALLPAVSTRSSIGGYVDVPQAAFVIGALGALLLSPHRPGTLQDDPSPWLLLGLPLVKSEGLILLGVFCGAIGLLWLSSRGRHFFSLCRQYSRSIAVVIAGAALRVLYLIWVHPNDLTYGPLDYPHLVRARGLSLEVPLVCLGHLLDRREWGLFWPGFFVAGAVLLLSGNARQRLIALGSGVAILLYTSIFYFTNWNYKLQIDQAYDRLLCQVAPVAALCIGAAFAKIVGDRNSESARMAQDDGVDRKGIRVSL